MTSTTSNDKYRRGDAGRQQRSAKTKLGILQYALGKARDAAHNSRCNGEVEEAMEHSRTAAHLSREIRDLCE